LLILVWGVYFSIELNNLINEYKQVQWENSPLYIAEQVVKNKKALHSAAHNKYDHFKLSCLAFGSDMKLLKALEAAGHTPEYQETLKEDLYKRQSTLIERWFLFDSLLFSGASDHTTFVYYYKHLKPRSI
jgi:hypothetical protein